MLKKILFYALAFCVACFLIALGIQYLLSVKWALLAIAAIAIAAVVGYRIWQSRRF